MGTWEAQNTGLANPGLVVQVFTFTAASYYKMSWGFETHLENLKHLSLGENFPTGLKLSNWVKNGINKAISQSFNN